MFLSLPLFNTCSRGGMFCILDAQQKRNDKPQSFSFNTNKFNLKQVKQKPLEVCVIGKVVGCLEFYIFPGYKNINILLVILFTINIFTQYYTVLSFLKRYFIENYLIQSCLILKTTTPQQPLSDGHKKALYELKSCIWIQLEKG